MSAPKMKPCPFCGEARLLKTVRMFFDKILRISDYFVECQQCGARGPAGTTKRMAVISWNRRAKEGKR